MHACISKHLISGSQAEAVIYEWSSAVVHGVAALESKFMAVFLIGDRMTEEANAEIADYFAWCCKVLMSGKFPAEDFYGEAWPDGSWRKSKVDQPIAGQYRAVFSGMFHDAKARHETHTSSSIIIGVPTSAINVLLLLHFH